MWSVGDVGGLCKYARGRIECMHIALTSLQQSDESSIGRGLEIPKKVWTSRKKKGGRRRRGRKEENKRVVDGTAVRP